MEQMVVGSCAFIVGKIPCLNSDAVPTGEDFKRNLQIADLDFATIHVYPSNWGVPAGTCLSWVNNDWIGDRAALAAAAGKPLVLEVGIVTLCSGSCGSLTLRLRLRFASDAYRRQDFTLRLRTVNTDPGPQSASSLQRRQTRHCMPLKPTVPGAAAGVRHAKRLLS